MSSVCLQPVLVRPVGPDRYELIAGERRWRAAKRAGLPTLPALVKDVEAVDALEQALVENVQRQDLNALEEAAAYQQLVEEFGLTHEEVARRIGKSRSAICNTLRLMQLPPTHPEARGRRPSCRPAMPEPCSAPRTAPTRRRWPAERCRTGFRCGRSRTPSGSARRSPTAAPPPPDGPTAKRLRPPGLLELEELLSDRLDTRGQGVAWDPGAARS